MADGDFAAPFEQMAARIRRFGAEEFGGALLVVPPTGEPIAILMVTPDPKGEEPLFWAQIKAKVDEDAVRRLDKLSQPDPWSRR